MGLQGVGMWSGREADSVELRNPVVALCDWLHPVMAAEWVAWHMSQAAAL